jgi:peptidoglycan/xylan/chitin deacetylase (PgdA/CDA1 family)
MVLRGRARRYVTILTYHRIGEPGPEYPFDPGVFSVTPEEFERELQYLKRCLDVVSVDDLAAGLHDPAQLPERAALITFDDGYLDNYQTAFPLLRAAGLPACFFLSTGIVGSSRIPWWDQVACCMKHSRFGTLSSPFTVDPSPFVLKEAGPTAATARFLRNLKRLPWPQAMEYLDRLREETRVDPGTYAPEPLFMSWDQAREMQAGGMNLGGHTRFHPILGNVTDPDQLLAEIAGCHADLMAQTGVKPLAFAYPVGSAQAMSENADAVIREAGFELIFSFTHSLASRVNQGRIARLKADFGHDHAAFLLGMMLSPATSLG